MTASWKFSADSFRGKNNTFEPGKSLLILILLLSSFSANGENSKYPVSEISPELMVNAKAVIRSEVQVLTIKSVSDASIRHYVAITILNENAIRLATFMERYDKFIKINNIHGTIYNAAGEKVEQLFQDRLIDHSSISSTNLFDDSRVKYFEPKYRTYPFTVEYSFETDLIGYNDFPAWNPCRDFNISVQNSAYRIVTSNPDYFRSYSSGNRFSPESKANKNDSSFTWKLSNQPAIEKEPFSKSITDYMPVVHFAPNNFSIGGYDGNMTSWENFGKWVKEMNYGRNVISDEKKAIINELIRDCPDKYEQARRIYEYFQKVTRYVSVQIGIGGWRPIEAMEVDRLGYGDCKALANYLQALLASANINSYYTLVLAGKDESPLLSEFPSQQFNHAIICLPIDNDTLWLECTNQKIPFGYNGTFTDGREVLVVNEFDGGHLTRTHTFDSLVNVRNRRYAISLYSTGDARIKLNTDYSGIYFDDRFTYLDMDAEHQKKMTYSNFIAAGLSLDFFEMKVISGKNPVISENIACSVSGYSTITGSRMLVQFNRLFAPPELPKRVAKRISPVFIQRDLVQNDTITVTIPGDYAIESLPGGLAVSSPFGYCRYSVTRLDDHLMQFTRHFVIKAGTYPPELYNQLRSFITAVAFNDGMKMSLKKVQ
jgi:hypothetical protein